MVAKLPKIEFYWSAIYVILVFLLVYIGVDTGLKAGIILTQMYLCVAVLGIFLADFRGLVFTFIIVNLLIGPAKVLGYDAALSDLTKIFFVTCFFYFFKAQRFVYALVLFFPIWAAVMDFYHDFEIDVIAKNFISYLSFLGMGTALHQIYLAKFQHYKISQIFSFSLSIIVLLFIFANIYQVFFQKSVVLNIFGFSFGRPAGINGSIHNNGTALLVLLWLMSLFKSSFASGHQMLYLLKYPILGMAGLSQRIYLIAYIVAKFPFLTLLTVLIIITFIPIDFLDASNALKLAMWILTLDAYSDASIFEQILGHGRGSAASLIGASDVSFGSIFSGGKWDILINGDYPVHNAYVQVLYEYGFFGLVLYVVPIILAFYWSRFGDKTTNFMIVCLFLNYFVHSGITTYLLTLCMFVLCQHSMKRK
jgi:hypothetical protein